MAPSRRRLVWGFTLLELLVVIGIIGILVTLGAVSLINVQKRARDSRRLSDMKEIVAALEAYKGDHGNYPVNADGDCGGYDIGFRTTGDNNPPDTFIQVLVTEGYLKKPVGDPLSSRSTNVCYGGFGVKDEFAYYYYRYAPGTYGCPIDEGYFYVLGVRHMESTTGPSPHSPGFKCGTNDWGTAGGGLEWVTASYE